MGEPATSITLLGRVAIAHEGQEPAVPRGRRAELVFAFLAAEHHRLVTHDELADALWPEGLPDTWEAALRGVLTDVRRFVADNGLVPGELLVTARRGYEMHVPPTVRVDIDEAREALEAASADLAEDRAASAATRARRAASLAALPFLPNHEGEWVDRVRHELATTHARALEIGIRAHAAAGDLTAAASVAERFVHAEPFNEAAHQLRIRVLAQGGDRSGAIKAYEHCREVLRAELGVEPSAETTEMYRAVIDPEGPRETAPSSAPPSPTATGDADLGSLSMLVVEDHDFQRRTAVMLLRNLGVGGVLEASDGGAALAVLADTAVPDVVLCDIDMPGMDGVEFIRHVAERELASAVIIASALDAKVLHAVRAIGEGYGLQVLGAIEKPLTARRLGELLATYRPRPSARSIGVADGSKPITAAEAGAAFSQGAITLHLQPSVDVASGELAAAGTVPRWHDPAKGWVSPAAFLPVLDREGLRVSLAERALDIACASAHDCASAGLTVSMCVALTPEQLHDPALSEGAVGVVRASDTDPARITFELAERSLRGAAGPALGTLTRLRVKGFGVSITDFDEGTAASPQLAGVPLTEVRLASHLVTGASSDTRRARALEATISAARDLDVTIVADGCESEADLRVLLELGCHRIQGSFIADAIPAGDLLGWASQWDPDRLVLSERG